MALDDKMPIVWPLIGSPTSALLSYESEEQREQHEEDMARYFGVSLPAVIRRNQPKIFDYAASLRTPTSVQLPCGFPSSSPVKKDGAKTNLPLPLLQLDAPMQLNGAYETPGKDEKLRVSRERNRMHAQRTRIRKRELLASLKERIETLQDEYELLKQAYDFHVTAVCLLRLGKVRNVPCVEKIEQIGRSSTEDKDERTQLWDAEDVEIDETLEHDHELNLNGKRVYASTMSSDVLMYSKEERKCVRRERNRLHARRARFRKKVVLERSQQAVHELCERNNRLRHRLHVLVSSIYGSEACVDVVNATS